MNPKNNQINLLDLYYYFDATKRDSIDRGNIGRKSWQYLALKDQILALPEPQFELAMRTLQNMVSHRDPEIGDLTADKKSALQLFQDAAAHKADAPKTTLAS